jgi:hypothetical protein
MLIRIKNNRWRPDVSFRIAAALALKPHREFRRKPAHSSSGARGRGSPARTRAGRKSRPLRERLGATFREEPEIALSGLPELSAFPTPSRGEKGCSWRKTLMYNINSNHPMRLSASSTAPHCRRGQTPLGGRGAAHRNCGFGDAPLLEPYNSALEAAQSLIEIHDGRLHVAGCWRSYL